jgi:ComF family protein
LVDLLANVQRRHPLNQATRIVPVPLHQERQKARGFNQAAVIAEALSARVSLPIDEISLMRTEHTSRHRAGMDARDRRESVANAFTISYPALIAGERVLLIDDVFTTGATVSACANALLDAGAAEVFVLTIARPLSN